MPDPARSSGRRVGWCGVTVVLEQAPERLLHLRTGLRQASGSARGNVDLRGWDAPGVGVHAVPLGKHENWSSRLRSVQTVSRAPATSLSHGCAPRDPAAARIAQHRGDDLEKLGRDIGRLVMVQDRAPSLAWRGWA
jgi:hypothetical protein